MFNLIIEASLDNSSRAFLPFKHLVIEFLAIHLITHETHETRISAGKPISWITVRMSNAHLGVALPPLQLAPHAVKLDSLEKVVLPPPAAPTAVDSKISDAIVALFAHMNVICKDLIEHIGLVHERMHCGVPRT